MRVQFETGLDDLVDVNLRLVANTKWGGRQRTRSIWGAAISFAVSLFLVAAIVARVSSGAALLVLAGFSAALALVFAVIYRSTYDSRLRRHIRGYVEEQLQGARTWICEIELRPDGAWSRSHGLELTFPWSEATSVEDLADGVLLRFRPGVIFARNRAFATSEQRKTFVELARTAAQNA